MRFGIFINSCVCALVMSVAIAPSAVALRQAQGPSGSLVTPLSIDSAPLDTEPVEESASLSTTVTEPVEVASSPQLHSTNKARSKTSRAPQEHHQPRVALAFCHQQGDRRKAHSARALHHLRNSMPGIPLSGTHHSAQLTPFRHPLLRHAHQSLLRSSHQEGHAS